MKLGEPERHPVVIYEHKPGDDWSWDHPLDEAEVEYPRPSFAEVLAFLEDRVRRHIPIKLAYKNYVYDCYHLADCEAGCRCKNAGKAAILSPGGESMYLGEVPSFIMTLLRPHVVDEFDDRPIV